jgi:hypothetical protein
MDREHYAALDQLAPGDRIWLDGAWNRPRLLDLLEDPRVTTRFWQKVDQSGTCWLWTAAKNPGGYGKFCLRKPLTMDAHRVSYQLTYGPIARGIVVCHRCDVPACVRPEHLFAGTHADNVHDMVRKGRNARGASLNRPSQVGQENYAAKLTEADVRCILARHVAGDRPTVIAADFHIAYRTVWAITRGKRWGHLQ